MGHRSVRIHPGIHDLADEHTAASHNHTGGLPWWRWMVQPTFPGCGGGRSPAPQPTANDTQQTLSAFTIRFPQSRVRQTANKNRSKPTPEITTNTGPVPLVFADNLTPSGNIWEATQEPDAVEGQSKGGGRRELGIVAPLEFQKISGPFQVLAVHPLFWAFPTASALWLPIPSQPVKR